LGWNNNPFEVMKLQAFLNGHMNSGLAIHGIFDIAVMDAVRAFQLLHWEEILKPWVPLGLASEITPTGFVYKTTKHFINSTACPNLELEMPILP
jgi:hypothetical protein